MERKRILIGGEWTDAPETVVVRSPYTGQHLGDVASAAENEVEAALHSATEAAKQTRSLPRFQSAAGLRAIASGINSRRDEFTRNIAQESGKPLQYARGEVDRAIATFSWAAGEAERFVGEVVPVDTQPVGRGKSAYSTRVPRGVIFGITPFNFPLNLVAHKVAPALASGNSIIIKPSPRTPLTALLLGEVFLESELPKGALQVVPMDVRHIETILNDDRVAMISFTGSAEVGWALKGRASKKAVALELGGNAPVIVDESADVERSIGRSVTAAFAYSGQVCISAQRIFVHERLFDTWTAEFVKRAESLKGGDPTDEKTQISNLIDEAAARRIEEWIGEAVAAGAKLLCGGDRRGSFVEPTVLTHTDEELRVVSEEAFGPVAVVERFSSFDEAVEMVNRGRYGLQAGVFTRDLLNAGTAARDLNFGSVIINDAPSFRVDNMPYGGVRDSGFGREGVRYAMEEMTEMRLIVSEF
jgi:glyceraldehyde-3-phosphate dehydrogenase (NADP+)